MMPVKFLGSGSGNIISIKCAKEQKLPVFLDLKEDKVPQRNVLFINEVQF